VKPTRRQRGLKAQKNRREIERSIRIDTVTFAEWAENLGIAQREAAGKLEMRPGTLANWQRRWEEDQLAIEPLGRPCHRSDWEDRQNMIAIFYLAGPGIGIPTLRCFFPGTPRSELEYMLARYRDLHLDRDKVLLHVLRWTQPGTVWAMDFTKPPQPVDGIYPYIFLVRDLASGNTLLALPVPSREIKHVIAALAGLFSQYTPPLVLKSDNEFDTWTVQDAPSRRDWAEESWAALRRLVALLSEHGVVPLLSPSYYPEYNAAIEAGIGSFKTRAHHEAARHGHPEQWNCDDVEAARLQANELARPWGTDQDTPDIAWAERRPITREQRADFSAAVQQAESELRQTKTEGLLPGMPLGPKDMASARRESIARALTAQGFLKVRRRRFTLGIKRSVLSNIR
jgi:hypothetical protein